MRERAEDVDRYVGARLRERRIMLGLTQQQLAELVGVTYQQAHKYEKGLNRIAAGRLHAAAEALGVGVDYFFEGLGDAAAFEPTPQQRMLLELARDLADIPSPRHREALCALARVIGGAEKGEGSDEAGGGRPGTVKGGRG